MAATPNVSSSKGHPIVNLDRAGEIAGRVERFVRSVVATYEGDSRVGPHGPSEELVGEVRAKARVAGVLTRHILADGSHLTHRETAVVLRAAGLSTLGPFNMFRLAAIFHGIKGRLIRGNSASAHAADAVATLPLIAEQTWLQTGAD